MGGAADLCMLAVALWAVLAVSITQGELTADSNGYTYTDDSGLHFSLAVDSPQDAADFPQFSTQTTTTANTDIYGDVFAAAAASGGVQATTTDDTGLVFSLDPDDVGAGSNGGASLAYQPIPGTSSVPSSTFTPGPWTLGAYSTFYGGADASGTMGMAIKPLILPADHQVEFAQ
jgi:hypothetical protein